MKYLFYHFTKARLTNGVRYYDCLRKEWYRKDYVQYWNNEKSEKKGILFAFFDFELPPKGLCSETIRDINIPVLCIKDQHISRKEILAVGQKSILELLLCTELNML